MHRTELSLTKASASKHDHAKFAGEYDREDNESGHGQDERVLLNRLVLCRADVVEDPAIVDDQVAELVTKGCETKAE